jgi:hypothetical protein
LRHRVTLVKRAGVCAKLHGAIAYFDIRTPWIHGAIAQSDTRGPWTPRCNRRNLNINSTVETFLQRHAEFAASQFISYVAWPWLDSSFLHCRRTSVRTGKQCCHLPLCQPISKARCRYFFLHTITFLLYF